MIPQKVGRRACRMGTHRIADALCTQRHATAPPAEPGTSAAEASPLSRVMLKITFHPIPRMDHRSPFAVAAQTLHVLGSTTLHELRSALVFACEGIPGVAEELAPEEGEDDMEDDEDDMEDEGEEQTVEHNTQAPEELRWKSESRKTGSVFAIDDVLYADQQEGMTDYAA